MTKPLAFSAPARVLLGVAIASALSCAPEPEATEAGNGATTGERFAEIFAERDRVRRFALLGELFSELGPEAAPEVEAAFGAAPLDTGSVELLLLAAWWAERDPEAAFAWTRTDWRANDARVIAEVIRAWARRDPHAALDATFSLHNEAQRTLALDNALAGWEESGQPGLVEYVAGHSDVTERQQLGETLGRSRALVLGVEGALAWAEALPEDPFRREMVPRVASAGALIDPGAVAAWAGPRIKASEGLSNLPRRIGTRWVRSDPRAAMAWLSTLPPGDDRKDGLVESFRTWHRIDPIGAQIWMKQLEPEPWNEPVRAIYARQMLSGTDPQRALEIVADFEDENLRNYHITVIARAWLRRDYDAANAWLEKAEVPDEVRRRARMAPRQRPGAPRGNPAGAREDRDAGGGAGAS